MYGRIIRNDVSNSRMITFATVVFVAAAAMLVSLSVILTVNLTGAIDTLMQQAKTPHFMQMHSGAIDMERLEGFAGENELVEDFQVLGFLNIDNSRIVIGGNSLDGNVQDNGLSVQSNKFDHLLDLDGNVIRVSDGELYVPVCYMKDGTAKAGDTALIAGKEFKVAGFLRDSQMNSLLASSKRFLVSENDYSVLKDMGKEEYLIEFRLKDPSDLSSFEQAYASAGLEANGPTVTYPLFKTMSGISDGLMIAVILIVSLLVTAVAFMCIRFTLLAKIEEDYREIGVMKAIGLRLSDIKKIYLVKYAAIAAAGCVLGYALSFLCMGPLLESIRLSLGTSKNSGLAPVFCVPGLALVFLAVYSYVNGVLKRFRDISASEAIRFGAPKEKTSKSDRFHLSGSRVISANVFLGLKDVLTRKKLYIKMLAVLAVSAFIVIVPQNLYHTVSSKSFITFMGTGDCDIRFDIQQTDGIAAKAGEIARALKSDPEISKFSVSTTRAFTMIGDDETEETLKIESGDHTVFPVRYSDGRPPETDDEISLSVLNAKELGKKTGGTITLLTDGGEKTLVVCGTYSDITNGGKTAKAVFQDGDADIMSCVICAELTDESAVKSKTAEYAKRFDYAKVSDIKEYISQTMGSSIESIGKASLASDAVALVISALVTLLFMKMLITKDRYSISVMKAVGFRNRDISAQYIVRAVFVAVIGIVFGVLLANTAGEFLAGRLIACFGAASFHFAPNFLSSYVFVPLIMIITVCASTAVEAADAAGIKISEHIKTNY